MIHQRTIPISALSTEHKKRLLESGIDSERSQERGYYTEHSGAALGRLGFARNQLQTPALVIPIHGPKGRTYEITGSRYGSDATSP